MVSEVYSFPWQSMTQEMQKVRDQWQTLCESAAEGSCLSMYEARLLLTYIQQLEKEHREMREVLAECWKRLWRGIEADEALEVQVNAVLSPKVQ